MKKFVLIILALGITRAGAQIAQVVPGTPTPSPAPTPTPTPLAIQHDETTLAGRNAMLADDHVLLYEDFEKYSVGASLASIQSAGMDASKWAKDAPGGTTNKQKWGAIGEHGGHISIVSSNDAAVAYPHPGSGMGSLPGGGNASMKLSFDAGSCIPQPSFDKNFAPIVGSANLIGPTNAYPTLYYRWYCKWPSNFWPSPPSGHNGMKFKGSNGNSASKPGGAPARNGSERFEFYISNERIGQNDNIGTYGGACPPSNNPNMTSHGVNYTIAVGSSQSLPGDSPWGVHSYSYWVGRDSNTTWTTGLNKAGTTTGCSGTGYDRVVTNCQIDMSTLKDADGVTRTFPNFCPRGIPVPARNKWYCFEAMLKCNTVNSGNPTLMFRDGELKIWIDGILQADFTDLAFRNHIDPTNASSTIMGINEALLEFGTGGSITNGVCSQPNATANAKYIDNVIVADQYIGPIGATVVNTAPTFNNCNGASTCSTSMNVGTQVSYLITTNGTPTPAVTYNDSSINSGGGLPSIGLSGVPDNNSGTLTIAGTPTQQGTFTVSLTASNLTPPNDTQTLTLNIGPQIVPNNPPTCSIRNPTDGSTSGPTISVSADASDIDTQNDPTNKVKNVQFTLDTQNPVTVLPDINTPNLFSTTYVNVSVGSHTIKAVATDTMNPALSSSPASTITVTVSSALPTPPSSVIVSP